MNKPSALLLAFAIVILFFIQLAGTLVESIYILDLLKTKLDEKALGVLFFFMPVLLFPFFKKAPRRLAWSLAGMLIIARGMLPYLNTSNRMLASGLGTAAAASLFFLLLSTRTKGERSSQLGKWGSVGLGLALLLSVCLRTVGSGLDLSLIPAGEWLGWSLAVVLGILVAGLDWEVPAPAVKKTGRVSGATMGIILVLSLIWFSFSAPSVIARWTEGNYAFIVLTVSLLAAGWVWVSLTRASLVDRISPRALITWNILFTLSLTGMLLAQRVPFPPAPDSAPVVVVTPGALTQLMLFLTLLLFPILFLDFRLFLRRILQAGVAPRDLVPGFLLGTLVMVVLIFVNVFSNVWGYVRPVSLMFRGTFWLAFFVLAGTITLLVWRLQQTQQIPETNPNQRLPWGWGLLLAALLLVTVFRVMPAGWVPVETADRTSMVVMTFNTQQSNDEEGERSFDRQLALMRRISPDVIALQESDSARISLNNNDYVRYFAEQLGYFSYYGPTPVTGTYGTAILSRYPLENTQTVFSYSDADEIGTSVAQIEVAGRRFTIYNVHPAGSDSAMLAFARILLERSRDEPYVIALGDYNLREDEEAYQLIDDVYVNAWTEVYPSEVSPDGVDMSGENRIDHIFVSPSLAVRNPVYILPADSATDHPVHWTEIVWETP